MSSLSYKLLKLASLLGEEQHMEHVYVKKASRREISTKFLLQLDVTGVNKADDCLKAE